MATDNFNPYVGLRPFREDENLWFFGRDQQTLELLQRLHRHRFVAVVGGSGSGKSSLIRAGLIPALKGGYLVEDSSKWLVSVMKPGSDPMYNFARSILQQIEPGHSDETVSAVVKKIKREGTRAILQLIDPIRKAQNTNIFLLVDQFEELFRFSMNKRNAAKRAQAIDFVNLILNLAKSKAVPFYVVLTMRSDFIGDCAKFRNLPEAMNESQYLVPQITRQQLKKIIEGPARLYGGQVDPALTARLINDLQKVKDELPLLQHTLMRIWNHEVLVDKSGQMDLGDYEAIGGIVRALSLHADEALQELETTDRAIAEELFKALTDTDENGRKIRRPLLFSDLKELTGVGDQRLMRIIQNFVDKNRSFLIVEHKGGAGDRMIDISHESLIRQWNRLGGWVKNEEINATQYKALVEAAQLHTLGKKDVLSGTELQLALDWNEKFRPKPVWANRYQEGFNAAMHYLDKSREERARMQIAERNRRRKFRFLALGIMGLIILFSGYAIVTNGSIRIKNKNIQKAKLRADNNNKALELYTQATVVLSKDPTIALRLLNEALNIYDFHAFRQKAEQIIINKPLYQIKIQDTMDANAIDMAPDGKQVIIGNDRGAINLWDLNGELVRHFKGHESHITAVKYLPDGSGFLSSAADKSLYMWDLEGNLIAQAKGEFSAVSSIQVSAEGIIATGHTNGMIHFWNKELMTEQSFRAHNSKVSGLAFSPDGGRLLTGSQDRTAKLFDLKGNTLQEFKGHRGEIYAVAFSPTEDLILTGSWDSNARLWNLQGEVVEEFKGHFGAILSVAFSTDGNRILTGSFDNGMSLWDVKEGKLLREFVGHQSEVGLTYFGEEGKSIISGSRDGSIREWYYTGAQRLAFVDPSANRSARFAPDGKTFLTGTQGKALIWDLNGKLIKTLNCQGTGMVFSTEFSPDGERIVTCSQDGTIRMWRSNGDLVWSKKDVAIDARAAVRSADFAPNGRSFVTGSWDFRLRQWDLDGNLIKEFVHDKGITSVAFHPEGELVAAATFGRTLIWDLTTNTTKEIVEPSQRFVNGVAFSPDGTQLLTGSQDNGARIWDLNGNLIKEFKGPRGAVRSVDFSHDGQYILTGTAGGTTRLWDLDANIRAEYRYDKGTVFTVSFAEDDRSFLMGSGDMLYHLNVIDVERFFAETPFESLNTEQKKYYMPKD